MYQYELLDCYERGQNERFGRIEFTIGCPVSRSFKQAVSEIWEDAWKPLRKKTNTDEPVTEWAEVCFVPNALCQKKDSPAYRYIVKRQRMTDEPYLPGLEPV